MILLLLLLCFCVLSPSVGGMVQNKELNTLYDNHQPSQKYSLDYNGTTFLYSIYEVINDANFENYYKDNPSWWNSLYNAPINDYIVYTSNSSPNLRQNALLCTSYTDIDYDTLSPSSGATYYSFDTIRIYYRGYTLLYEDVDNEDYVYQYTLDLYFYRSSDNTAVINDYIRFYYIDYFGGGTFLTYAGNYGSFNNYCIVFNRYDSPFFENLFDPPFYDNYLQGLEDGYNSGYFYGRQDGYASGYQNGYNDGLNEGVNIDDTAFTIFSGIIDVALLPVNMFLRIFNFEVFGVNISGFISALLTISIVIIIIRFLFGGKNDS